jgi:hypothetical protein
MWILGGYLIKVSRNVPEKVQSKVAVRSYVEYIYFT